MADPTPLTDRTGSGQAAGNQAQFNQFLILFTRFLATQEVLLVPTGLYAVQDWSTGDLDIVVAFPALTTGTFVIKTATATNVYLPARGGPWIIQDGLGDASSDNITVIPPGILTIRGAANFVMATNWQSELFNLDGTDFLVSP